jgi:hypothetical protein
MCKSAVDVGKSRGEHDDVPVLIGASLTTDSRCHRCREVEFDGTLPFAGNCVYDIPE